MNLKTAILAAKGLGTYVPLLGRIRRGSTGGTCSARYCYGVWMRHLRTAHGNALGTSPRTVAELGPGDSLGVGLAALLCGACRYWALDVVPFANVQTNLGILDELVAMFRARSAIPDGRELPRLYPPLGRYEFPHDLLPPERMEAALEERRIESIRAALAGPRAGARGEGILPLRVAGVPPAGIEIAYHVPWHNERVIAPGAVDMVLSQSVLEYVDDLAGTHAALWKWAAGGGFVSHQISFSAHGLTEDWNGHWALGDAIWKMMKGRRRIWISRHPHSVHVAEMQRAGFRIVGDLALTDPAGIGRSQLARRFRALSEEDLHTRATVFQAVKSPAD